MFLVETRNGIFISKGEVESEGQINFTLQFPNEKIRNITKIEETAIHINGIGFFSED